MPMLSEGQFSQIAKAKLNGYWTPALRVFQLFGNRWSFDIALLLLHASAQKQTDRVLSILERHLNSPYLMTIPPHMVFDHIREKILGLRAAV